MGRAGVITALASLLVVLATASLFAIASGCATLRHAAGARRRRVVLGAALAAAVAAAWTLLSPLVAMAVPLAFAAAYASRGALRADDLSEYVAASDRARSDEPPWWPEFEYEFRRECQRYARARRR